MHGPFFFFGDGLEHVREYLGQQVGLLLARFGLWSSSYDYVASEFRLLHGTS
jgi:hypothetical protein